MKSKAIAIMGLALSLGLMTGAPVLGADDDAIEAMAVVLAELDHVPNDAQKEAMQAIIDDSDAGEQEQVVASAISNLNHKASAEDKEKLQAIMDDEAASADLRELAGVVYRLNHKPSAEDQELLSAIISD